MSFKEYNQDQLFVLPPSLHEFLPDGHLAHVINEVVNELDLRGFFERYSNLGSSAYHPQMMLKVLFYGYAMGERSSREGKKKCSKRKYTVEPVFGDMKFNRKMRGLLLKGKLRAGGEFLIICIAHNLRKIAKHLGMSHQGLRLQPLMV